MRNVIRQFNTKNFKVIVTAEPEHDSDLSWGEDGSKAERLQSGELVEFCAKAAVYFHGHEIATDYLGNCIYESHAAFMDHKECGKQNKERAANGEPGRCGSFFTDMVKSVCRDARIAMAKMQSVHIRTGKKGH